MVERTVKFTLNNIKDGEADLQMRVRWGGGNLLVTNLGYRISVTKWDNDLQQCRNNTTHGKKKIPASEINKEIRRYRRAVEDASYEFNHDAVPSREEFRSAIDSMLGRVGSAPAGYSVLASAAYLDFIGRESKLRSWARSTMCNHAGGRRVLMEWKPDATMGDLDAKGLEDFFIWLQDKKSIRNTTLNAYLLRLKTFLLWADKKGGYKVPSSYATFQPRIKTLRKTVVWLSWDEVMKLRSAELPATADGHPYIHPNETIRDLFVFACMTGLRYSDIYSLRHSAVRDGKIFVSIQKTSAPIVVELNKYAKEILDRYDGFDDIYCFPRIRINVADFRIKKICRMVGIDAPTTVAYYKGSERVEEVEPKYKFVSMHTGRRTFICNALEKGISPQIVMKWTGHKGYEEMRPYIDISDKAKETAMKLFDV